MIVFRGKSVATLEKRLQKFVIKNNYKILVVCQDKGCVDKHLFTKWLKEIWFVIYSFKKRENTVFIFEQSTTHFTDDLEEIFDKYNLNSF